MKRIELVIDEVVWHGGDPGQRDTFGADLQAALARELAQPRLQASLANGRNDIASLDAGPVARVAGDTVARAVAGGITRATRSRP